MAGRLAEVKVTGLKPVLRALKQLPEKSRKKVIKPAVTKSATPVVKYAKKLVPLGDGLKPGGAPREHLRKTITKSKTKIYKSGVVVVVIGPRARAAPHSHLVDKDTKPHDIPLTKPLTLNNVTLPAGFVIKHPGTTGIHFLDRAVDATQAQVQSKLEKEIAKGIEKEAAKLAGK